MTYRSVAAPPAAPGGSPVMMQYATPQGVSRPPVCHSALDALLLSFEGSNGSTTFTDSSKFARSVTPVGNAAISTAKQKFGLSAGVFDGTGDYLTVPYSELWVPPSDVDLTYEVFIYPTSVSGSIRSITSTRQGPTGGLTSGGVQWQITSSGTLQAWGGASDTSTAFNIISGVAVPANTWSHVALTRKSRVWRLYQQGSLLATSAVINNLNGGNVALNIGRDTQNAGREFVGYMDSFRIRVGEALYSGSTYTVPTAEFQLP